MGIKMIQVFEGVMPSPDKNVFLLHLTDAVDKQVLISIIRECHGYHAVLKFGANSYTDVQAHLPDWLHDLDFRNEEVTLAIYSDCGKVSALDAAFIAHMVVPEVPLKDPKGERIEGFKFNCAPIFSKNIIAGRLQETVHG